MDMVEEDTIRLPLLDGEDGRKERRDAVKNRAHILATAEQLFAEQGVAQVNMADIATAAGVGKGTLYRNFVNKGELCLALLDAQMTEFQNERLAQMQQMAAQNVPAMAQLDVFLDALVYFTDAHLLLLCEVQREGLFRDRESDDLQMPHFWQHMTVSALLKTAVTEGDLSPDLDTQYMADAILAPLKADIFHFQREVRQFSLERISAGLRLLAAGLRQ
ncbi:MAG: TetR family transcriptional regulator [Chloroflexi bacterium]|nr:TetR family transcriptional regulator [Chloroflexota bacterium]